MAAVALPPRVQIAAHGRPLPDGESATLASVRVQQRLALPAQCSLVFADLDGHLGSSFSLEVGTPIRVGLEGGDVPLFEGEVTVVEYAYTSLYEREIRVRAYDPLHRLRKRQQVRAMVQVTAADLAQELVADLMLAVDAADPGPLRQRVFQHDQSDLDLLTEVTERAGLYPTLREGRLHLVTLEGTGDTVDLQLGRNLLEARIEVSSEPSCGRVSASGWSFLRAEPVTGEATEARVGHRVPDSPSPIGANGERHLTTAAVEGPSHAEAAAQAELDRLVGHEAVLRGLAEGDVRLRPGTPVEVGGVAEGVAGRYVLTSVVHTIEGSTGYVSELSTEPPPRRPRREGTRATLGVVTAVDDPEEAGRIRASLPAYGDIETEWLQVLSAAAGAGKGLVALPDRGDQVLVLLDERDPVQGVVLGGLYGIEGPTDSGVHEGAVSRFALQTPGGQRVQLDDGARAIRLDDSTGSYVHLTPERVTVHAAVPLTLEAPGQTITVRGLQIDFEQAKDAET